MDNLAAHKGQRIKELIEERGCELMYLPPYSPDLSPIEEAFSKVKRLLREAEARTRKSLIEAMVWRSLRLRLRTLTPSSSTAGTVSPFNHYD